MTFERPGGTRVDTRLTPIDADEYRATFADPAFGHYPSRLPTASRPLSLSNGSSLWARTLAGGSAVFVQFNSVTPPDTAVVRRIERLVRGRAVRRVVLDVRLNGGGDNTTYAQLTSLFGSPRVDRRGRLYLLTGRATFSAAANFAAEIERDTRAIVVGEPTGGGVETYGDTTAVLLPTVGLYVHIAAQYHERRRGPKDRRLAVEPDVAVALTSAAYFARRDPVLERALRGL
jgi:C-terminal processing protease CtpA/Prc